MVNILIATNNVNLIKRLINKIINNCNVKISKITTEEEETINMLNNENIDIVFLDSEMPNNAVNIILEKLRKNKKKSYKNSIIIISNSFSEVGQMVKNDMIIDYILKDMSEEEIIYKINKIIEIKNIEGKRKAIIKELEYIKYNIEYKGTNYLIDTILQMNINRELDSLQKDIYPIIANMHKKSVNTIRCNIRRVTECMYYECDNNRLKEYFGLTNDQKPTIKEVIYTVLNKIS